MKHLAGWLTFVLVMFSTTLVGHPISMTQTDAYATRTSLKIAIDLFVEDLFLFHGLEPTNDNYLAAADIKSAVEKHKVFLLERFVVRDAAGEPIAGKVIAVEMGEMDPKGIPMTELMAHSLVYRLEFALPAGCEFLTFTQTMGTTSFGFPAIMLLRLKQEGSEVPYVAEMRSNEPHTVRLDWDHPPLAADASEKEWEAWDAKRREQSLGITSYSSVYSFLYVEDFEVRHEVLVPLLTLEGSVPLERKEPDFLDVDEQESAKPAIAAFFQRANPIKIDGIAVTPVVDRIDFFGLDFKDFAQKADKRRVSMVNARVGIILSYPLHTREKVKPVEEPAKPAMSGPKSVELTWDFFNKFVFGAQTIVFAFETTHSQFFSPYQKTYQWTNPGRPALPTIERVSLELPAPTTYQVPMLSLGLACFGVVLAWVRRHRPTWAVLAIAGGVMGAILARGVGCVDVRNPLEPTPTLSSESARSVFGRLHANVYRAFDYRDEKAVYDSLAQSITGPLLEEIYLAVRKGLVMDEQGGAVARVAGVELVEGAMSPATGESDPRAFAYRATWRVDGTVEHWGHIHTRQNEYEAVFTLRPVDDAWRIASTELLSEERKSFKTRLRSFQ
jgi:hypothetical protein